MNEILMDLGSMVNEVNESGSELLLVNGKEMNANDFYKYVRDNEYNITLAYEEDDIIYIVIYDNEYEIEIA